MAKIKEPEIITQPSYEDLKHQIQTLVESKEKVDKELRARTLEKEQAEQELKRVKGSATESREGMDKFLEECYLELFQAKTLLKGGSGLKIRNQVLPKFYPFLTKARCEALEFESLGCNRPKQ